MNKNDSILAESLAIYPHLLAFDLVVKKRLDMLQLDRLLVYMIDSVHKDALPFLAGQFDILGWKGMRLAHTEQQQRELIKRAIELKRYRGTVWAVEEAMKAIGFTDAILEEHADGHWAQFRVVLLNENVGISASTIGDLIAMINEYKNARSLLVDVRMDLLISDEMEIDDVSDLSVEIIDGDDISFTSSLLYDGTGLYNGEFDHSGDSDFVTIEDL